MEYPVLSIVPPAVDIEASPVVDFGGRGKSCDFTVKAEAAGFEPVPLWLLLVLRVGPDEPYLLATACFDMRRYVQKAAAQMSDHPPVPFDRIKLALAPTTDLPGSVEVSVFLRMSKVCGTAPLRRDKASEAVEPPRQQQQQPTVVCATANLVAGVRGLLLCPLSANSTAAVENGLDLLCVAAPANTLYGYPHPIKVMGHLGYPLPLLRFTTF
ncbi:hypothetical protein FOL47_009414 [Perkinsus chesapeaki]|uniref:Uncharacterized protein n=1 Tax=Perkinsus chesapeaki TaxID=330153 RepID=A0A7J6L8E7_PERCH|nr:hypothetical protein FOL47_009414 [Perkinsus chesapeaki]